MNNDMRAQHMEQITDTVAIRCYDRLCAACETRQEGMNDQDQMMVADIATMEQMKQELYADIRARGVVEDWHNGRQRMKRENKSIQSARIKSKHRRHSSGVKRHEISPP